jgi:hypothetical protein
MKNSTPATRNASVLKLFIFTLLFFISIPSTPLYSAPDNTPITTRGMDCGVTNDQVVKYLYERGYVVNKLEDVAGCCDKIATTQYSYRTRVYIQDGKIVTTEDIP